MREFWEGLSQVSRIFVAIAVPATVVMIIQSILMLFGIGDGGGDADVDIDDAGGAIGDSGSDGGDGDFSLLSVRGLVAFFSIGGWTGVVCDTAGAGIALTSVISFLAGFAALVGVAFLFRAAVRLQGNGNINIENAAGKSGKVYIPIPPRGRGQGKINIVLQGQLIEAEAVTSQDEMIPTGTDVTVERVENDRILVVKPTDYSAE